MELEYPINLVGFEVADAAGEVITRDGEYLGTWSFAVRQDNGEDLGELSFTPDGAIETLFVVDVGSIETSFGIGFALSEMHALIKNWHQTQQEGSVL
jgi:hypothetical protein